MDGLSAYMIQQESAGNYMHTLKISIIDPNDLPDGWSFERFIDMVSRRIHRIPMYRWKLLKVPFGLHHPVWVDDPDFDLRYHVRRIACPVPGDRRAFCDLVSQVYAWKMDMSKPLWVCWVVEGLENGRVALITLLHHAYTDGSGAARLLETFFTAEPETEDKKAEPWTAERTPGRMELLARALVDLPITLARCLPQIGRGIANARRMKRKYLDSGKELPPNVVKDTRESPFNIMLGPARTFVFETFELSDIRAISKNFGVTINDLFVASAAGAYRKLLQSRGSDPDAGPLVASIPVAKRPPIAEDDFIGNKTTADYLALPVHLSDPLERLKAAHHAGNIMKEHLASVEGVDIGSVLEVTPPIVLRWLSWMVKRRKGQFGIFGNAALSNVPGPREPLYLGQAKMTNWISMGQVIHGMGLNTTVWSYAGKFNLCVLADRNLLPDGWELVEYYREAFETYRELTATGGVAV